MNLEQILKNILTTANYPADKHSEFIFTFYKYLFYKLLITIEPIDTIAFNKMANAINKSKDNPKELEQIWLELSENHQIKEKINKVAEEVIAELVDDIASSATDPQKQQILAILPA